MTIDEMLEVKKEKGFSYAMIAEMSGVPLGTVQKVLGGGTTAPRYETLRALEDFFEKHKNGWQVREEVVYKAEKRQGEYVLEDYYALPEDCRAELIDGVIYDMGAPGFTHQWVAGEIYHQIRVFLEKKQGKCIPMIAPVDVGLDCDERTMVQPDVLILCRPDRIKKWGVLGAPDFVAEILSPSTRKKDLCIKMTKYLEAGVREYWAIDPDRGKVIIYTLENEGIPVVHGIRGRIPAAIYDGELEIDMDRVAQIIQNMEAAGE